MNDIDRLQQDLAFVRGTVERSRDAAPPSIFVLWGVIIAVGYTLADVAPMMAGWFWTFAAPLGGIASWLIGKHAGHSKGQADRRALTAHALHWGATSVASFSVMGLLVAREAYDLIGPVTLLVASLSWFLAGVQLEPRFKAIGLVQWCGFMLSFFLDAWASTLAGVLVAGSCFATAFLMRRDAQERS